MSALTIAGMLAGGATVAATRGPGEPGRTGPGTALLINGRAITPAGQQSDLGDLPVNSVLSPDGGHLLVVNSGAGIQSLQVVATATGQVVQTIQYFVPDSVFVGAAYSPDGRAAYVSGGGFDQVHTFTVGGDGQLAKAGDIQIGTLKENPFPIGLSVSPDGKQLAVANNLSNNLALVDLGSRTVSATIPVGGYPYGALFSPDGKRVFVSNWGDATVSVVDVATRAVSATIKVGSHPNTMIWGAPGQLIVADANSDAVSVVDTAANREAGRISVSPYKNAPLSSSPEGLAISQDHQRLYVADAGADEVTILQLNHKAGEADDGEGGPILGRIPTAWYPTSVTLSKDGSTLFVTNAKGSGAGPNDSGFYPDPSRVGAPIKGGVEGYADGYCNCTFDKYTGSMIVGTLSLVPLPSQARLDIYTRQVARNNRYGDESGERDEGNPVPIAGRGSPIKHVIYIIKENRTYDQVFGDLKPGNGSSALTLFPAKDTPNLHALAERFGILDNFYADSEVSADGHNWATSANATDYNQKMWPQNYSPSVGRNRGYDFEGGSTINLSPGGYLWDAAVKANLSLRDYGEFANNGDVHSAVLIPESGAADACPGPIAHSYIDTTIPAGQVLCFPPTTVSATTTPALVGRVAPKFRSYDLRYGEADRVAEWSREYDKFEAAGNLPSLEIMRLPNDHTAGTTPGRPTPQAYVAENDAAVGKVVDVVSHSRDWASTAIVITEDDAQNGPDHVDAHRTTSLVVSPYTQRSKPFVDHTLYNTSAMLRTIELILGMQALSQYDANALPMWRLFHKGADVSAFNSLSEQVAGTTMNTADSYGAARSAAWSFEKEDEAPMGQLNEVIWHAIKGPDKPYPTEHDSEPGQKDTDG